MSPNSENSLMVSLQNNEDLPAELREEILADARDSLNEMMAGTDPKFPKIKIAPGGVNNWIIGEEADAKKTFNGLILTNAKANAYWHKEDNTNNPIFLDLPEGNNYELPLCHSFDGITGSRERELVQENGNQVGCFGRCSDCFLNEYGTTVNDSGARGRGKACKNGRRLLVIMDGVEFPFILTLPPTSIKNFDAYVTMLRGKKKPLWSIWTTFALEQVRDGQIAYSVFKPGAPVDIMPNLIVDIYNLRKQFKPQIQTAITEDEFASSVSDDDNESPI